MIEREEACRKQEEVPKIREGIVEKLMAEIEFVYKPTLKDDIYESDYLEQFSQLRRADLVLCGALEAHNEFWTANSVEFGNIFASLPAKLIGDEKAENLVALGCQRVDVRLYLASDVQLSEIYRACERAFPNYLIVKENKGSRFIILEYRLGKRERTIKDLAVMPGLVLCCRMLASITMAASRLVTANIFLRFLGLL